MRPTQEGIRREIVARAMFAGSLFAPMTVLLALFKVPPIIVTIIGGLGLALFLLALVAHRITWHDSEGPYDD